VSFFEGWLAWSHDGWAVVVASSGSCVNTFYKVTVLINYGGMGWDTRFWGTLSLVERIKTKTQHPSDVRALPPDSDSLDLLCDAAWPPYLGE